jgi:hypothetical protein
MRAKRKRSKFALMLCRGGFGDDGKVQIWRNRASFVQPTPLISQSLASILFKAPANPARYESSEGEGGDDDDNDDEDDEEASDFDEAEGEEEADGKADGEGDGTRQSFSFSSNPYSSTIILHPNSPC